jgi:putative FmdB family regulatory protein
VSVRRRLRLDGAKELAPVYDLVMPLFEYACKECDKEFELLVRGSETPECPSCHSTELQRRLSVFAAHSHGGSPASAMPAMGACGSCGDPRGPGSCSIN